MKIIILTDKLPVRGVVPLRKESRITTLVIHNDAAPAPSTAAREVQRIVHEAHFHVYKRGWHCLGYHYVISKAGRVYKCSPVTRVTAHARGGNATGVGIALQGNFEIGPAPSDVQLAAVVDLMRELKAAIPSIAYVLPHRCVAGSRTDCPGRLLSDKKISELARQLGIGE